MNYSVLFCNRATSVIYKQWPNRHISH